MSKHNVDIDIQKIAQDVENIRFFLNRLERLIQKSLEEKKEIKE